MEISMKIRVSFLLEKTYRSSKNSIDYRFVRTTNHLSCFCITGNARLTIVNKRTENMKEEVADVRRHFNGTPLIFGITTEFLDKWRGKRVEGSRRNAIPSSYRVSLLRERNSLKRFEILREGNAISFRLGVYLESGQNSLFTSNSSK